MVILLGELSFKVDSRLGSGNGKLAELIFALLEERLRFLDMFIISFICTEVGDDAINGNPLNEPTELFSSGPRWSRDVDAVLQHHLKSTC
jgi:hypothetical protein